MQIYTTRISFPEIIISKQHLYHLGSCWGNLYNGLKRFLVTHHYYFFFFKFVVMLPFNSILKIQSMTEFSYLCVI